MSKTNKDKLERINDEMRFIMRISDRLIDEDIVKINKIIDELLINVVRVSDESIQLLKKKCEGCGETHPKYFHKNVKTKCTQCNSVKDYNTNIKPIIEKGKERNLNAKIKRGSCMDCKLLIDDKNESMFEWDHKNPSEKTFAISRMHARKDDLYYAEIEKCDLVCSNCHSLRTKKHWENNMINKKTSIKKIKLQNT
jgi:hypothetical protein